MQPAAGHTHPQRTAWTLIRAGQAAATDATTRRDCLAYLADTFREPVRQFIRRWGAFPESDVDDLTQEYFLRFIEGGWLDTLDGDRGRLRNFLRTSVRHFLLNHKRGIKRRPHQVEYTDEAGAPGADGDADDAGRIFDRQWTRTLMATALGRMAKTYAERSRSREFDLFREVYCGDALNGKASYRELAQQHRLTEAQVRNTLHRGKAHLERELRAVIRETVVDDAAVDEEIRGMRGLFS